MEFGTVVLAIMALAVIVAGGFLAGRLVSQNDSRRKFWGWMLIAVVAVLAIALPTMVLYRVYSILDLYQGFLESLSDAGVDRRLAKGILAFAFLPYAILISWFFSPRSQRRKIARAGIVVYVAAFNIVMYSLTKDRPFGHERIENQDNPPARKWYAMTPEGCTFYDSPGFDTKWGIQLQPVTPEAVIECMSLKDQATGIDFQDSTVFFDRATGRAVKWYSIDKQGLIAIYPYAGFDQVTRRPLQAVSPEIVSQYYWQRDSVNIDRKTKQEIHADSAHFAQKEQFRRRLLNNTSAFRSRTDIAIIPTKETLSRYGIDLSGVRNDLVNHLRSAGFQVVGSPFTEAFIAEGYADSLVTNDMRILRDLRLTDLKGQLMLVDIREVEAGVNPVGSQEIIELSAHLSRVGFDGVGQFDRNVPAKGVGKNSQIAFQQALANLKSRIGELR
jgi:hypothetical protein